MAEDSSIENEAADCLASSRGFEIQSYFHCYRGGYWLSQNGAREVIDRLKSAGFTIARSSMEEKK